MIRHASQDGGLRERSYGLHGFREEGDHHLGWYLLIEVMFDVFGGSEGEEI